MFRKKRMAAKVFRVKDAYMRLANWSYYNKSPKNLRWAFQVMDFLKDDLGLKSVQIIDGPMVDLFDIDSRCEFETHFNNNQVVDILIPNTAPISGWKLQTSGHV